MSTQATAARPTNASVPATPPAANGRRESILVLETDPAFGELLVEQLVADGHPAQLARSEEHARLLAADRPPRLLLLGDLDAPRGTLDVLEGIRGHQPYSTDLQDSPPWSSTMPVIVLSSRTTEPDLLRAFEAGADDFLARPVRYLELCGRDCEPYCAAPSTHTTSPKDRFTGGRPGCPRCQPRGQTPRSASLGVIRPGRNTIEATTFSDEACSSWSSLPHKAVVRPRSRTRSRR